MSQAGTLLSLILNYLGNHKAGHYPDVIGNHRPKDFGLEMTPTLPVTYFQVKTPLQVGDGRFYATSPLLQAGLHVLAAGYIL